MDDRELSDALLEGDLEAGTPSVENALFVVLGALSTLAVILRLAGIV